MEVLLAEEYRLLLAERQRPINIPGLRISPLLQARHGRIDELVIALDLLLVVGVLLPHVLPSPLHRDGILALHLAQVVLLADIARDGDQQPLELVVP